MTTVEAAFSRATTATYALRNASDLERTRYRRAAGDAVQAYATAAGIDPAEAITRVCNWLDEQFNDLDAARSTS